MEFDDFVRRMLTEQRRHPRAVRSFWLWFRPAASDESWQATPLRDLSVAGARFLSERAFEVGSVLSAKLRLPASPAVVPLTIRVAWSRPVDGQWSLTEHGVTFEFLDATMRQHLLNAVRETREQNTKSSDQHERHQG